MVKFACYLVLALLPTPLAAAEIKVSIRADFPGGNVVVVKNEGNTIELAPDLRGGRPWFYWYFEAEASQPGKVTFAFANPPMVGVRGPAISLDDGKSWQWHGAEHVAYAPPPGKDGVKQRESFTYEFTAKNLKVRFAVVIPYGQSELDEFLKKHGKNPHLTQKVLTKSTKGKAVELFQIGKPGPNVKTLLLTARHHACETMASYVLEGFIEEALSDSPAGVAFRKRFALFVVPFVDKDGVLAGDQGKNRNPHDHNRDYGKTQLYPEIKAIQELADAQNVRFAIDLHCPFLRGDVHEAFYFDGLTIPHINDNVNELIAWIKEERPPATSWPLNFMKKPPMIAPENGMPCSHYFAYKKDVILATTLEVPFTQPNCPLDAAMARQYGVALLRAFLRTKFVSEDRKVTGGTTDSEELRTLRSAYQPLYRGKPEEARKLVDALVKNAPPDSVYRVERVNLLGLIHLHQKQFSAAWFCFVLVLGDEHATTQQRATAATQVLAIAFSDPASTPAYIDNALAEFNRFPYPSAEQLLRVYNLSADYFQAQKNYARALRNIELLYPIALSYEKGKTLNRMAALYDLLKQPEMALASRKEAVALLRKQLDPMPVGVSGPLMANDLFEALQGIPSATLQEKKEAAEMVLNHKVTPVALKEKVRKALAELEKK